MVQIYPSHIIFCQNNSMIGRHFLYRRNRYRPFFIKLIQIGNIPLPAHGNKFLKNLCSTGRIVYCPVVVFQGNPHCLCHRIQLKTIQLGKEESRHSYGIYAGIFPFNSQILIIFLNKTHIKLCIVSHHDAVPAEFFKFRQNHVNGWSVFYHVVIDTGQLFNAERNGNLRIYKLRKPLRNLPVHHFNCANFNNLILHGRKSSGFNIKHHKSALKALSFAVLHNTL